MLQLQCQEDSRGHKLLTINFPPAQSQGGSPSSASVVRVNKNRLAVGFDQNIKMILLKLDFYIQ